VNLWDFLWLAWLLAFAVIEGVAIRHDHHDAATGDRSTLSAHLRRWFHVNTHLGRTSWLVFSVLFMAFMIPHIGWL
jgi:hypothetical protein